MIYLIFITFLIIAHWYFDLTNVYNPFVLYIIFYSVFVYGGIIAHDLYYYQSYEISDQAYRLTIYGFIVPILLGILLDQYVFKNRYINKNKIAVTNSNLLTENILFLAIAIILFIYFVNASGFNFLDQGSKLERVTKQAGFGYVKMLTISLVFVSAPGLLFDSKLSKSIKIILFLISSVLLMGFGFRSQFLNFLLMLFLVGYFKSSKNISLGKFIGFGLFLYSLLVITGIFRLGLSNNMAEYFARRSLWRPFITINNFDGMLKVFGTEDHPYMFGSSILYDLSTLIPGAGGMSSLKYYNEVTKAIDMEGTITPSINGIIYSNFGEIGVYLLTITIPFFFLWVAFYWGRRRIITLDRLCLWIFINLSFKGVATTGIVLGLLYQVLPFYILYLTKTNLKNLIKFIAKLGKRKKEVSRKI